VRSVCCGGGVGPCVPASVHTWRVRLWRLAILEEAAEMGEGSPRTSSVQGDRTMTRDGDTLSTTLFFGSAPYLNGQRIFSPSLAYTTRCGFG
jgi:hypothetical protein